MRSDEYENLQKLSKEQLIKIIDDYNRCLGIIGEYCVSESKWHIESKDAVRKIGNCLCKYFTYTLYDKYLGEYINMNLGKISGEEYRSIVLDID